MSFEVLKPGLLTSVQDGGRHGHAASGVGHAGAMDPALLRLANALVGNRVDAAGLEITLAGPLLRCRTDCRIALCGAPLDARRDGSPLPMWQAVRIARGAVLDLRRMPLGARTWLAVAGGFALPRVLGSAATDLNARLGPFEGGALREGDVLPFDGAASDAGDARWSIDPRPWFDTDPQRPLRLLRGSHFAALDDASQTRLFDATFRIAAASNRVGIRLESESPLALRAPLEMVSEPVTTGTMQLPPAGTPIVLMAEHPTTGGYPRIGQLAAVDLGRLAQYRPGQTLRFVPIDPDTARALYLRRERALTRLEAAIRARTA